MKANVLTRIEPLSFGRASAIGDGRTTPATPSSPTGGHQPRAFTPENVGRIAHDLNNSLGVVNGFAELALAASRPDDPRHRYLVDIQKAGAHAVELTRQLAELESHAGAEPPTADGRAEARPSITPSLRALPYNSETILLVEDNPTARDATAHLLRARGYTVVEAGSGEEALAGVAVPDSPAIDLVITDMVMPWMSGQRLAKLLQARQPRLAVLFTSGYSHAALAQTGLDQADAHFLPKPFTAAALVAKVRAVLSERGRQTGAA